MDPLGLAASLIAVAQATIAIVDTCYKWRSAVRDSSKQALQIVQQLDSLRCILERLIEIVENESPGSTRLSALTSLSQKGGPLDTCIVNLDELQLQLQPKTGWKAVGNALVWPLKEDETRKVLQGLNDIKTTLYLALDTDHTVLALQMDSGIKNLTIATDSIKNNEYRREIVNWISAPDPFPTHNTARKRRQLSTGTWFLDSSLFTRWIRGDGSMLWLHGIPGCGKSVLCSTTVERLYSITQQNASVSVAYFYFDFQNFGDCTVEALVRSLVVQLFNQSNEIPSELKLLRGRFKGNNNKPPLFKANAGSVATDGLDECEETQDLLVTLKEFLDWNLDMLHILVFSQQQREIDEFMTNERVSTLCLDESSISSDINLYLEEQLRSEKFSKWPEDVRLEIYRALRGGANGMFRWAACQLDIVRSSPTLKSLRRDLRSLPKSLEETYDRILTRIPEGYKPYASRILTWLSFATRPTSLAEVAEMLAVDFEDNNPCYDAENRLADPRDVLLMCSSLVFTSSASLKEVYEEIGYDEYNFSELVGSNTKLQHLRLAHLSVKDYLLSEHIKGSSASEVGIDTRSANDLIAQTCLAYLLSPALESGPCVHSAVRSRLRDWPLLSYAVQFWPHHTKVSSPLSTKTWIQIQKFFSTRSRQNGGNYAAWIQLLAPDSHRARQSPPLYYVSSFGMYEVAKRMIDQDPAMNIEAKGGRYLSSALHVAVYRGRNDVAKLLIDAGANVNDRNCLGESILLWAHLRNTKDMQTLLQEHSARLNLSDTADIKISQFRKQPASTTTTTHRMKGPVT